MATQSRFLASWLDPSPHPQPVPSVQESARFGRADDKREVARIARALRAGVGHVVVTARDVDRAENLVEAALGLSDPYRVVRISATTDGLAVLAGEVLAFAAEEAPGVNRARDRVTTPIGALVREARAAGRPVVMVVADADLAGAKRLETLRIQLDAAPGAIEVVRMVLIGCPVLTRILDLPSARGLRSRVGMQVRLVERRARQRTR